MDNYHIAGCLKLTGGAHIDFAFRTQAESISHAQEIVKHLFVLEHDDIVHIISAQRRPTGPTGSNLMNEIARRMGLRPDKTIYGGNEEEHV